MTLAAEIAPRLAGAAGISATVALLLWRADRRLPHTATAPFARSLQAGLPPSPDDTDAFAAALLAAGIAHPRAAGLLTHLLRGALGCLAVAAIFWAMTTPRLPAGFLTDADALLRFAGRLVLSGLVTVLLVHWAAAAIAGPLAPRIARAGPAGAPGFVLLDFAIRLAALVAVSAATFALYARTSGSFGGSWRTALAVVPDTLAAALRLEGLSGIYVWAALIGGYPLALVALARLATLPAAGPARRALTRLPMLRDRPARALGLALGLAAGAAALVLSLALEAARTAGL